jgi:hypothetical protein
MQALYAEAVEVSQAAQAFEDLVEFDSTVEFVEKIQIAQKNLIAHILSLTEPAVISAATSGSKYATVYEFGGNDLFEGFSTLFMLFGGIDQERRDQLGQYGFDGCYSALTYALSPFYVKHSWDRASHTNSITLFWE